MHLLWWGNIEPYFIQTYKADEYYKKHITVDLQPPNTLEQLDEIGEMKKRFTYDLIDLKKLSSDVKHTIEVDIIKILNQKIEHVYVIFYLVHLVGFLYYLLVKIEHHLEKMLLKMLHLIFLVLMEYQYKINKYIQITIRPPLIMFPPKSKNPSISL